MNYLLIIFFLININIFGMAEDSDDESTNASRIIDRNNNISILGKAKNFFKNILSRRSESEQNLRRSLLTNSESQQHLRQPLLKNKQENFMIAESGSMMFKSIQEIKNLHQRERKFFEDQFNKKCDEEKRKFLNQKAELEKEREEIIEFEREKNNVIRRLYTQLHRSAIESEIIINKERNDIKDKERKNELRIRQMSNDIKESNEKELKIIEEENKKINNELKELELNKKYSDEEKKLFLERIFKKSFELKERLIDINQKKKLEENQIINIQEEFAKEKKREFDALSEKIHANKLKEELEEKKLDDQFFQFKKEIDDRQESQKNKKKDLEWLQHFSERTHDSYRKNFMEKEQGFNILKNSDEIFEIEQKWLNRPYSELDDEIDSLVDYRIFGSATPYKEWEWVRWLYSKEEKTIYGLRQEDRNTWWYLMEKNDVFVYIEPGKCHIFLKSLALCQSIRKKYAITFRQALEDHYEEWAIGGRKLPQHYLDGLRKYLEDPERPF